MKKKCIQCGRPFEGGVSTQICSNSCLRILKAKTEAQVRTVLARLRRT